MMKKFVSLFLAAAMAFTFTAAPAFAASVETIELEDDDPQLGAALVPGQTVAAFPTEIKFQQHLHDDDRSPLPLLHPTADN